MLLDPHEGICINLSAPAFDQTGGVKLGLALGKHLPSMKTWDRCFLAARIAKYCCFVWASSFLSVSFPDRLRVSFRFAHYANAHTSMDDCILPTSTT
jgi:hypothetical protein